MLDEQTPNIPGAAIKDIIGINQGNDNGFVVLSFVNTEGQRFYITPDDGITGDFLEAALFSRANHTDDIPSTDQSMTTFGVPFELLFWDNDDATLYRTTSDKTLEPLTSYHN